MPADITLFLAPTASEARRAAWQFLGENRALEGQSALQNLLDPPLIFTDASGGRAWRELAREAISQTTLAPRLVRAEAFFARLHASISDKRALSGADRLWVLQSATRRAATKNEAASALQPEFLKQFAVQIAALRGANLERFPAAQNADEWNEWLRAYDARLHELGAFDFEAAPALFALSATRNQEFPRPRVLGIDGLLDPSPALQIGLDALLERVEIVAATLVCPGGVEDDAALQSALVFWKSRGAKIVHCGDFGCKTARLAAKILGAESEIEAPSHLFLTPAHTPQREMELIAAQIRCEIEAGARPGDFCLAFADLDSYQEDALCAFAQYGVPLDWPRARDLKTSPLVRALLRAAHSCHAPLNVHELHDLFGDGTLRLQSEEKVFDARRLRAAALAANHPELADLDAARISFERKRAQFTKNPRHDNEVLRARIEASILAGDLELVAVFETLRAPFCQACSASAWQNQLLELTDALTSHWLENETESEAATRAQANIARFKSAIEAVAERARGFADHRNDEGEKKSADEWLRWLEIEISQRAVEDAESQSGGVRAVSLSRFEFGARATFFCGLSERAWPISNSGGALGRELTPILGAHFASPLVRATHVLARAVGETAALYLSHAQNIAGKETPASPLLDDLKAAFPDAKWPRLEITKSRATRRDWLVESHHFLWNGGVFEEETRADWGAQLQTLFEMRAQRSEAALGIYDGVLGPRGRELMEARDARGGGARLSGSDLEFYARCPIRYFFERVLGLRHETRGDGDIDARESGTLVHEIARHFLLRWKTPLQGEDFEAALEVLCDVTTKECEKLPLRPILREAEWHRLLGADGRSGPLAKWLQLETGAGSGAWGREMRPITHSNVQLDGVSTGLEHRFEIEIGGHKLKGFIDRLDASANLEQIAVIDYKTGDLSSLPSWKNGDSGLHFQLAVYALAVRDRTAHLQEKPRLAMAYLSLRRAKIARGIGQEGTLGKGCVGGKMLGDASFEAWLDDARMRAIRIADLRGGGVFNISLQSRKDAKCDGCTSKTLCGRSDETQAARLEVHLGSPFVYAPALRDWDA
ncbi:PD-(D/E)XK nuclease superfamily protein [Abditibacterium utsteinense]|uniref:PD-(D/E)XK nuclease superfamily protein n=1 Tax=Abditibacterium utsteinense TaxID=1960156 RepID=A0A2S8SWK4_9BACT|nr:PD-(D/E)XK nuclease family protein [Abditibacterium utsteinense]PQV65139.1 PD-(D/E)XK nuclease superfamily protein [Abditibacterium utsteinense]